MFGGRTVGFGIAIHIQPETVLHVIIDVHVVVDAGLAHGGDEGIHLLDGR